ncbi:conserved exported hypothetical protein [Paraburkholderia sacchari]|uniref:hypothetical protein n=1 Tax=Paraburkholderia sacchari TaxID=159450 RepID=UPI0039A4AF3D
MGKFTSFFVSLFLAFSVRAAENSKSFSPVPGVKAVIELQSNHLIWKTYYRNGTAQGDVNIDTEKIIHVNVESYDFSGRYGFSVWHVDDGMGVYSVYRVFTFSPSSNRFVERIPSPICGDEFVNLKVDKKGHRLVSTYWNNNVPKQCVTRLLIER